MIITYIFPRMGYGAGITNILTEIIQIKKLTDQHSFQLIAVEESNVTDLSLKALQLGIKVRLSPSDNQLTKIIEASDILVFHYWNCPSSYAFLKKIQSFNLAIRLCISLRVNGKFLPQVPPEWLLASAHGIIKVHPKTKLEDLENTPIITIPSLIEIPNEKSLHSIPSFNNFKMLYGGAFTPFKIHPDFWDLHSDLAIKNYRLDIYGNTLSENAEIRKNISFKGFTKNLKQLIPNYHILCNPQHRLAYSSFDKIMKECQFQGVPPIVLKDSSVGDLIEHNVDGIIAEDLIDYRLKLKELANDKIYYDKIRQSTYEYTYATYQPEKIVAETLNFYHLLVKTKAKESIKGKIPSTPLEACLDGMGITKITLIKNPKSLLKDELLFALNCEGGLAQFSNYFQNNEQLKEFIMQVSKN